MDYQRNLLTLLLSNLAVADVPEFSRSISFVFRTENMKADVQVCLQVLRFSGTGVHDALTV